MTGFVALVTWQGPAAAAAVKHATEALRSRAGDQPIVAAHSPLGTVLLAPAPPGSRHGRDTSPVVLDDVVVSGDVRLDNRTELRVDLDAPDATDLTLMALAYRRWGVDAGRHLIGDFAAVLLDGKNHRVVAIRDHLGIRHAAFAHTPCHGVALMVATDPGHIAHVMDGPRYLDPQAVADQFSGYRAHPHQLVLAGLHRLQPASVTVFAPDSVEAARYWQLDLQHVVRRPFAEHVVRVRAALEVAVQDRIPPDGLIGSDLSGGLDSTAITALAAKLAGPHRVLAVSAVYPGEECDEQPYIDAAVRHIGCEHCTVEPTKPDPDEIARITAVVGLPLALNVTPEPGPMVAELVARGGTVMLTGEGGDDWFTSSPELIADMLVQGRLGPAWTLLRTNRPIGGAIRALVKRGLLPLLSPQIRARVMPTSRHEELDWIGSKLVVPSTCEPVDTALRGSWRRRRRGRADFVDVHDAWNDLHSWAVGAATALHGVENRHPLMDVRLVEEILCVPDEYHWHGGWRGFQKAVQQDLLPAEIRNRVDKAEFSVVSSRYLLDLAGWFDDSELVKRAWLDAHGCGHLVDQGRRTVAGEHGRSVVGELMGVLGVEAVLRSGVATLPPSDG